MAGVRSFFEVNGGDVIAKFRLVLVFDTAEITDEILFAAKTIQ